MMKYERFTWKAEKLQHLDDEVIMVVDNANKEWKGHILNIVDMLNELNDERMMYKTTIDKRIVELEEENEQLKQKIQRWKNLYELKDSEVTARVDALNRVCEYYTSEVLFKSDVDPNKAVQEVINEILNTEVENDE